jgi:hypothetical protein
VGVFPLWPGVGGASRGLRGGDWTQNPIYDGRDASCQYLRVN